MLLGKIQLWISWHGTILPYRKYIAVPSCWSNKPDNVINVHNKCCLEITWKTLSEYTWFAQIAIHHMQEISVITTRNYTKMLSFHTMTTKTTLTVWYISGSRSPCCPDQGRPQLIQRARPTNSNPKYHSAVARTVEPPFQSTLFMMDTTVFGIVLSSWTIVNRMYAHLCDVSTKSMRVFGCKTLVARWNDHW